MEFRRVRLRSKGIAGEGGDGRGGSVRGPIAQPATDPLYLRVALDAGAGWEYALPEGQNAFAYVFEGGATIGEGDDARTLATHEMGVLGGGDTLRLQAGKDGARLVLVAGRPLREPEIGRAHV